MTAFFSPADIGNRAAQFCGANRMDPVLGFNDGSRVAAEIGSVYDKLRETELARNDWTCAIRRTVLRAIDGNAMLLQPALWNPTVTYFVGSIVNDQSGNAWMSRIPSNLANDPLLSSYWEPYFGPRSVPLYDASGTTAYYSGELVYTTAGDGTYRVYMSLQDGNSDVPGTATAYDSTVTYFQNQVVTYNSVAYMSVVDLNAGNQPDTHPSLWTTSFTGGKGSIKWLEIGGAEFPSGVALRKLNIIYPATSGPATQNDSRNAYHLPVGFLRVAEQNPKGIATWLGGPSGYRYTDWNFDNDYLVSADMGPISLRFVANLTDVRKMHPMFCEGLAARIATAVCETLTQSSAKLQSIASQYQKFIGEARTVDAIEQGYDDPPDDDYITVRL